MATLNEFRGMTGRKVMHSRRGSAVGVVVGIDANVVIVNWDGQPSRTRNNPVYLTILPEDKPVKAADINDLSNVQKNILSDLLRQVRETPVGQIVAGRRTDAAARTIGVANNVYSFDALALREAGLIVSQKDNKEFALWFLTSIGHAKAVELTNVRSKPEKWLVWCPTSAKPPQVVHSCEQEAMAVAESMARNYPGQLFHAVQVHAGFQLKAEKVEVKKIETKHTMVQV